PAGSLMPLAGRHVVLGVSGGIASYKSCVLARRLTEARAAVDVVLTAAASEFVRPVVFEALTGRPVLTSLWQPERALAHIALAKTPDLVILAPATANLLARAAAERLLAGQGGGRWAGRKVVVTAGPTREHMDPVRVITNPSSGRMGYALAEAALARGADVVLITGPTELPLPAGAAAVRVETTAEMQRAVQAVLKDA